MTLNDKIITWLKSQNITAAPGSFFTGQPEGEEEAIQEWSEELLGPVPTMEQMDAAIDVIKSAPPTKEQINTPILAQLSAIDMKSIRALREGDTERINALESQAANLRAQLME